MKKSVSLTQKVIRGGAWVFTLNIATRGLGFIRMVILARLLLPSDFGLVGIAMIATSMLLSFSGTGFAPALIQKKSGTADYLNTAWCVEVVRGIVLAFILFLFAPLIATFFNNPEAKLIIQVMAIAMALGGFTNMGIIYFQKELQFEKLFIYNFSTQMANLIVSVSLAFILRNAWALVYGTIVGVMTKVILSYTLHPFRPNLKFDLAKAKELFKFGKWILGSSILVFLLSQGDDIFVGKLLGVAALGFYLMAYRIISVPATEITHVISQVTFPAYSKLQENLVELRRTYSQTFQLTCLLSIFIAGLIFSLSNEITVVLLGEKWVPIVPVIQVFAFAGMLRALGATISPVFQGIGQPRIITQVQVALLISFAILIYPLTIRYGIVGTALASCGAALLPNFWFAHKLIKTIKYSSWQFLKEVGYPFMATIIMSLTIFTTKLYLGKAGSALHLILFIFMGFSIYSLVTYFFIKFFSYEVGTLLTKLIKSVRRV